MRAIRQWLAFLMHTLMPSSLVNTRRQTVPMRMDTCRVSYPVLPRENTDLRLDLKTTGL